VNRAATQKAARFQPNNTNTFTKATRLFAGCKWERHYFCVGWKLEGVFSVKIRNSNVEIRNKIEKGVNFGKRKNAAAAGIFVLSISAF
jgi:hypothetical protein